MRAHTIQSILAMLKPTEVGCLEWTGCQSGKPGKKYGQVSYQGKRTAVHVVIWEHFNGAKPKGKELDHLCFNRICCNLEHLELVTGSVNKKRGYDHWRALHPGEPWGCRPKEKKPKPIKPPKPPKPPHIPKKLGRPLGRKDSGPRKPRKNKSSDP